MSFPKDLNLSSNKPIAIASKPSINRYRSDNSSYQSGDVIKIEIPTGRQGQYLYTKDSFLELRIKVNQTNTAVAASATYIDGSVYSIFSRMRILHGSSVVEDTLYCNKLWTAIYDLQVNENERRGDCITKLVSDSTGTANQIFNNCNMGVQFYSTATANAAGVDSGFFFASIVLPSALLGSLSQKALPIGLMGASSIYLELELAPAATAFCTALNTVQINSYTVDNIYYNAKISTLPSDVDAALIQSTGGVINLPAVSYKTEMKNIPSGTSAFNDKFSFQYSSLKNFLFWMQNSATATATTQSAMNSRSCTARTRATLSEFYLTINGEAYPSQSIATPARMYMELLRSFGYLVDTNAGGILSFQNYTNDLQTVAGDAFAANGTDSVQKRFLAGIDLDRFGSYTTDTLMSGTSSIGQMIALQANFGTATTDNLVLYSAVMYDVLYNIEGGMLTAKF